MKSSKFLSSATNITLLDFSILILRFGSAGAMLYGHGLGKFKKLLSDEVIQFVDPFGLGATTTYGLVMFAEFICAAFVFFGLFTRIALIPLIINMFYIFFIHHQNHEFGDKEMPFLYLCAFVTLMLTGPGKHSFDRLFLRIKSTV
ncbi:MAG: DoxX family protein [Weeksellaceae bacterium]